MKNGYLKFITGLTMLVLCITIIPSPVSATSVWSDNFDDGNYDDWTVTYETWGAADGYLTALFDGTVNIHAISTASTQVVGTWSFDVYRTDTTPNGGTFMFFLVNGSDPLADTYGYGVRVAPGAIHLVKQVDGYGAIASLRFALYEGLQGTWTHIDVTRNSTGGFHVYVNATTAIAEPDLTYVDTDYSTSTRFVIYCTDPGSRIDNITVDDEFLITPPEPTSDTDTTTDTTTEPTPPALDDTTLLIVGVAVAGVVVVAIVIFMKRR